MEGEWVPWLNLTLSYMLGIDHKSRVCSLFISSQEERRMKLTRHHKETRNTKKRDCLSTERENSSQACIFFCCCHFDFVRCKGKSKTQFLFFFEKTSPRSSLVSLYFFVNSVFPFLLLGSLGASSSSFERYPSETHGMIWNCFHVFRSLPSVYFFAPSFILLLSDDLLFCLSLSCLLQRLWCIRHVEDRFLRERW